MKKLAVRVSLLIRFRSDRRSDYLGANLSAYLVNRSLRKNGRSMLWADYAWNDRSVQRTFKPNPFILVRRFDTVDKSL